VANNFLELIFAGQTRLERWRAGSMTTLSSNPMSCCATKKLSRWDANADSSVALMIHDYNSHVACLQADRIKSRCPSGSTERALLALRAANDTGMMTTRALSSGDKDARPAYTNYAPTFQYSAQLSITVVGAPDEQEECNKRETRAPRRTQNEQARAAERRIIHERFGG